METLNVDNLEFIFFGYIFSAFFDDVDNFFFGSMSKHHRIQFYKYEKKFF